MFRLSSCALTKLMPVLSPSRSLSELTLSRLWPFHRLVSAPSMRFLGSLPEKPTKPHGLKDIGIKNSFMIRSIKFTFSVNEFVSDKTKILTITEWNIISKGHQHMHHIWISIPAAQTLLEKMYEVSKNLGTNYIESPSEGRLSRFLDDEMNQVFEFRLANLSGNMFGLQIKRSCVGKANGSSVFIPLDGITKFQLKLSATMRHYEKTNDAYRQKSFDNICVRSFALEPKRYFLHLRRSNVNGDVLVKLSELNKESNKRRSIFVPVIAARTLFSLLIDAYRVIQSYEGCLPSIKQPRDLLHEKSFVHQNIEYSVQVLVSDPIMLRFGDMVLRIREQNLDNESLKSFIIIRSRGVHLLLKHCKEILHEYDRLKPTLINFDSSKLPDDEEQRKRSFDQEIAAVKIEPEPKVTGVKNWKNVEDVS